MLSPWFKMLLGCLLASQLIFIASLFADESPDKPPNFLLLIGDDMGVETLGCYGLGTDVAHTPNLDQLCAEGLRFDQFWAQPVCSPTRAAMLTGQYGFRNGVGTPATVPTLDDWNIPADTSGVATIGRAGLAGGQAMGAGGMGAGMAGGMGAMAPAAAPMNEAAASVAGRPSIRGDAFTFLNALKADKDTGYATAAVGKWHLANDANGGLDHPHRVGFDYYAGDFGSAPQSYYAWSKVVNGARPIGSTIYTTTDTANEAIAWLEQREDEPWFLWVAFNAPHTPIQLPPGSLLKSDASLSLKPEGGEDADQHAYFNAMIEAMDTEMGRILAGMDEATLANTYIIFMGDNGTEGGVVRPPFSTGKAKGSVYRGGVNVPFIVVGPGVEANRSTQAMGNVADLYTTVLDLSGVAQKIPGNVTLDSISLAPIIRGEKSTVRDFNYADRFGSTRTGVAYERTMRNEHYKLIEDLAEETEALFNLSDDPFENNNLLVSDLSDEARRNYTDLKQQMSDLAGSK